MTAPVRSGIAIRGMGLSCALGDSVATAMATHSSGVVPARRLNVGGFRDALSLAFFTQPAVDTGAIFSTDRAIRTITGVVNEAIADAGLSRRETESLPIFLGLSTFSIDDAMDEGGDAAGVIRPLIGYKEIGDIIAATLQSRGDQFAFQTACTSSANAAISASRMIELGRYPHALVVGVECANLATMSGFGGLQLLADEVKPFDRDRRGIVVGEGVGAMVLSTTAPASRPMRICSGASNIDSFRVTTANPDGVSIADVMRKAMARAGIAPSDVRGIKAHGTGSPMNDASEAAGIRRVFETPPPVCGLKSLVGHTLGACGATEMVLMSALLAEGVFPGTPGFETADPELGIVPTTAASTAPTGPYLLNFFGFGGHNTVVVVDRS